MLAGMAVLVGVQDSGLVLADGIGLVAVKVFSGALWTTGSTIGS